MLFPFPQENVNLDDDFALPRHVRARRSAEHETHTVKTQFHCGGFGLACVQEQSHRRDPGRSGDPSLLAPPQVHPPGAPGAWKSPSRSAVSENPIEGCLQTHGHKGNANCPLVQSHNECRRGR